MRNIDHGVSEKKIKELIGIVNSQFVAHDSMTKDLESANGNGIFNADYVDAKRKEIKKKYDEATIVRANQMLDCVSAIAEVETENVKVFDITEVEYQGAINMISLMGKNLDRNSADAIIVSLKGKFKALTFIKNAFKEKEIGYSESVARYFADPIAVIGNLQNDIESVSLGNMNFVKLLDIHKSILDLAVVLGIELSDDEKKANISEAQRIERARAVMGL